MAARFFRRFRELATERKKAPLADQGSHWVLPHQCFFLARNDILFL